MAGALEEGVVVDCLGGLFQYAILDTEIFYAFVNIIKNRCYFLLY